MRHFSTGISNDLPNGLFMGIRAFDSIFQRFVWVVPGTSLEKLSYSETDNTPRVLLKTATTAVSGVTCILHFATLPL